MLKINVSLSTHNRFWLRNKKKNIQTHTLSWRPAYDTFISPTLPYTGLAAARTLQRAFSLACIPALEIVTRPCSITSWIAVRSMSDILSNSSIQTTPLSARTIAPASSLLSPEKVQSRKYFRVKLQLFSFPSV